MANKNLRILAIIIIIIGVGLFIQNMPVQIQFSTFSSFNDFWEAMPGVAQQLVFYFIIVIIGVIMLFQANKSTSASSIGRR